MLSFTFHFVRFHLTFYRAILLLWMFLWQKLTDLSYFIWQIIISFVLTTVSVCVCVYSLSPKRWCWRSIYSADICISNFKLLFAFRIICEPSSSPALRHENTMFKKMTFLFLCRLHCRCLFVSLFHLITMCVCLFLFTHWFHRMLFANMKFIVD